MGYSRENRRAVEERLSTLRQNALKEAERRKKEVYARDEGILALDRELSHTAIDICRVAMGRKGDAAERIAALKEQNLEKQRQRQARLAALGLPSDYTSPHFSCEICRDTGYTDRGMCSCMKKMLAEEGFRSSGLGVLLQTQSFDNFSLQYYEGESQMYAKLALDKARRFAENFDKTHENLLFIGGTGLGKTHLSTAVARRAIERGFDVVYDGVQNILADFEHDRFKSGYEEGERRSEKYFDCDLLIIDDLGTEMSNQFTVSVLYQLLNTRLNRGMSMIINTNLGQHSLLERYEERITSRLLGEFFPFLFRGTDIRRQK